MDAAVVLTTTCDNVIGDINNNDQLHVEIIACNDNQFIICYNDYGFRVAT